MPPESGKPVNIKRRDPNGKGARVEAPPVRTTAVRDKDGLIRLALDLRAVASTTSAHDDAVMQILEIVVQRTRMASASWVEVSRTHPARVTLESFANIGLKTKAIQRLILESAKLTAEKQIPNVVRTDIVRGMILICIPIFQDNKTTGVLCAMAQDEENSHEQSFMICQLVASHYDLWRSRGEISSLDFELRSASAVLELVGKTEGCETLKEACVRTANELQQFFRCDYVAIGYCSGAMLSTKLMAISSTAEFDNHSRTTTLIRNTLDEAVIRGEFTSFPSRAPQNASNAIAHKKLTKHMRVNAAISIPLRNQEDEIIGAVTVLGNRELLHDQSATNLITAIEHPVGTSLAAVKQAEGGWFRKLCRMFVSKEKTDVKYAILAVTLIALISLFVPVPYRINCNCIAEPTIRNFSVAPYEGLLENTFVEPGDVVGKGQVLAKMDGREIRFKLSGLVAEREGAARKRDAFRTNGEISKSIQADLERQRLATEIELLEYRQQNLEITSQADGIVLTGSLDRRQNYPVSIGQTLYEIAPLNPLRVELSIPADEIMHVREGLVVKFRFDGFGVESINGTITRIRPSSTIRDEENVFVAEAVLENAEGSVRPGMKGYGRIYGNRRSLGWSLFHRPWERFVTAIGL